MHRSCLGVFLKTGCWNSLPEFSDSVNLECGLLLQMGGGGWRLRITALKHSQNSWIPLLALLPPSLRLPSSRYWTTASSIIGRLFPLPLSLHIPALLRTLNKISKNINQIGLTEFPQKAPSGHFMQSQMDSCSPQPIPQIFYL